MRYIIELVWNREFHWTYYDGCDDLENAIKRAKDIRDSGDGARIKKVQVVNTESDKIEWNG